MFDAQFLNFRSDQQVDFDVGKAAQISSRSVVTYVSFDSELIPTNSDGVFTSDVFRHMEAQALRRRDEGGRKRVAIFNVCER
jgi:hypothetical protein